MGMEIVYTIMVFGSLVFVGLMLCCTLNVARKYDDISEEDWQKFLEKEGEHDECERLSATVGKTGQND